MRELPVNNTLIEVLLKQVGDLEQDVARLKNENERLTAELAAFKKNSRNPSRPPSSPPLKDGEGNRRFGGQPAFRQPF